MFLNNNSIELKYQFSNPSDIHYLYYIKTAFKTPLNEIEKLLRRRVEESLI